MLGCYPCCRCYLPSRIEKIDCSLLSVWPVNWYNLIPEWSLNEAALGIYPQDHLGRKQRLEE